jgi:hypothetical protein
MRDDQMRARLQAYADEGGVPQSATPSAAELRRRGSRALMGRATATLLVVALAVGGAVVWASGGGGFGGAEVANQPKPVPPPASTAPAPPPATTAPAPPTSAPPPTTAATPTPAADRVLAADGLRGIANFGEPLDRVAARLRDRFGPPDEDRTWNQQDMQYFGACPGDRHRFLRWGRLYVLFTNGPTKYGPGGRWHFFAWYAEGQRVAGRLDPATAAGIRVGSTVADLRTAYGGSLEIFSAADQPPYDGFIVGRDFAGALTSTRTSGRVTQLSGGEACGE